MLRSFFWNPSVISSCILKFSALWSSLEFFRFKAGAYLYCLSSISLRLINPELFIVDLVLYVLLSVSGRFLSVSVNRLAEFSTVPNVRKFWKLLRIIVLFFGLIYGRDLVIFSSRYLIFDSCLAFYWIRSSIGITVSFLLLLQPFHFTGVFSPVSGEWSVDPSSDISV